MNAKEDMKHSNGGLTNIAHPINSILVTLHESVPHFNFIKNCTFPGNQTRHWPIL